MGGRPFLVAATVLVVLTALVPPPFAAAQESNEDTCDWYEIDGLGPVCETGNGLLKVRHANGRIGYTHGLDPIPNDVGPNGEPMPNTPASPVPPVCETDLVTGYYSVFIYARAYDDEDRYATMKPQLIDLVEQANGHLRLEASEHGATIDYKFECEGGTVKIYNVMLPTNKASASFSTIVSDLEAQGFDDGNVKYWVWYDDTGACGCGGTGHVYGDDSAAVTNLNNGNGQALFAVTFGYLSMRILMHENGHNMGAVQKSAPQSTDPGGTHPNGWHCWDGQDIMCYNDGAPRGSWYTASACTDRDHYDCNHDDYFHPSPPSGSYLDTHWNIAHSRNRFLAFGAGNAPPTLPAVSCTPDPADRHATVTCSFSASDDSSGLYYNVEWGDGGATTRVPSTGTVAPGTTESATHAWSTPGDHTVGVTAIDTDGAVSATGTYVIEILNQRPDRPVVSCAPDPSHRGQSVTCDFQSADDSTGVYYEVDFEDGSPVERVPASGTVAPGTTQTASHAWSWLADFTVVVYAIDVEGERSIAGTYIQDVVNVEPSISTLSCSPAESGRGETVSCSFSGEDPDTGELHFRIDWGNAIAYRYPPGGETPDGTIKTTSLSYKDAGTYTITVTPVDGDGGEGTPMTVDHIVVDRAPTMEALSCSPKPSGVGASATCSFRAADDGSGVAYTIDWGDGSPGQTVPASGFATPGLTQSATHTWTAGGTYTVTAWAIDDGGNMSPVRSWTQTVENAAPTIATLACSPSPSRPDEPVTCSFRANDDSTGVHYLVQWGDGTSTRVPTQGTLAPGSTQTATHTWSVEASYNVRVTATDNDPSPRSASRTVAHVVEVPCELHRTGTVAIGLGGVGVDGVSAAIEGDINPACLGETFILSGSFPADFDLCWLQGGAEIACHTSGRVESGPIPPGADAARVILKNGAGASYTLRVL